MSRRFGRGHRRTQSSTAPPLVYGLTDFDTANVLATASGVALVGSVSGHWKRWLHYVTAQSVNSVKRLVSQSNAAGGQGSYMDTLATNTSIRCIGHFTGPVAVTAPLFTITAPMIGLLLDTWEVWDQPAGRYRLYVNGAEIGAGTATALAYIPGSTSRLGIGVRSETPVVPATQNVICGIEGGDGFVPDAAEISAAYAATQAAVAAGTAPLLGVAGKTTWRAQVGASWTGTLEDEIGTSDMTMIAGTSAGLTHTSISPPGWA